jgi:hypothetical protein
MGMHVLLRGMLNPVRSTPARSGSTSRFGRGHLPVARHGMALFIGLTLLRLRQGASYV